MAKVLGYMGLIPFIGLGAATWLLVGSARAQAQFTLLAYGATILSFLGAIHWGLAMRDRLDPSPRWLIWGVAPSLVGWVAIVLSAPNGLWMLAGALWICLAVDRHQYPRFGLQGWLTMRLALTTVASLSCIAAALGNLR